MPQAPTTPTLTPPSPFPKIPIKVQLEDGSVETFLVDARTDQTRIPQVLEGAIRARTRMKKKMPDPGVEPPSMLPKTVFEGARRFLKGAVVEPAKQIGSDFVQGARMINTQPLEAIKLLPEAIQSPIRNASSSIERASGTPYNLRGSKGVTVGGVPAENFLGMIGRAAAAPNQGMEIASDVINSQPLIGPAATAFGERTAAGEGPEALGNLTTDVALAYASAKGGMRAYDRMTAKPPAPTAPPPEIPTHLTTDYIRNAVTTNPAMSKKLAASLKKALPPVVKQVEAAPKVKPTRVRVPIFIAGRNIPIYIGIESKMLTHMKNFLSSVNGSAQETFWMNRLLDAAATEDDTEGHRSPPTHNPNRTRNIIGLD